MTESTTAKAREILALYEREVPVETIAERTGFSPSWIWHLISVARGTPTEVEPDGSGSGTASNLEKPAARSLRMTERMIAYRAVFALNNVPVFRALGGATAMFWLRAVVEIHQTGDADGLTFGGRGDRYRSSGEFLSLLGGTESDLQDLLHRGLLLDLEGGGLDLPYDLGLRPRERAGGKSRAAAATGGAGPGGAPAPPRVPRNAPDPRQLHFGPTGLPRPQTRGDSPENTGDSSENRPGGVPENASNFAGVGGESGLAGGESNNNNTEESESNLGVVVETAGVSGPMAGGADSTEIRSGDSTNNDSTNNPGNDSTNNPGTPTADTPWVPLAADLLVLAGRSGHPSAAELNAVRGWLVAGVAPAVIRDAVRDIMGRKRHPIAPVLTYFDVRVRELAASPASWPAAAPPSAPATPPSPEDLALQERDRRLMTFWNDDRSCPLPRAFQAACSAGLEEAAHRWLAAWTAYQDASKPRDGRPPEWAEYVAAPAAHEAAMLEAEAFLTAPDG